MLAPFLLALVSAQSAPAAPAASLETPFAVTDGARLQLTPKLDGVIEGEEWDSLSTAGGVASFLQWEPGIVYVAATVPTGKDLVVSLDRKADGWLIGDDNVEIRVNVNAGTTNVSARGLDGSRREGPAWTTGSGFELSTRAVVGPDVAGQTTYEVAIQDPGLGLAADLAGSSLGVRVDAVDPAERLAEPFRPRNVATVRLETSRAAALPEGLRFRPEDWGREVMPGDATRMRMTFNGSDALGILRLEMRSEGVAKDQTNQLIVPFPKFDDKGRAIVDFDSRVVPEAETGYRILRGNLVFREGEPAVLQTSYLIAPLITFDLVRERREAKPGAQTLKVSFFMRSNSPRGVIGKFRVIPPERFGVPRGGEGDFTISTGRGRIRRVFDLEVPPAAQGVFPVTLEATVGATRIQRTFFLRIQ